MTIEKSIDLLVSFDTTGSMYPVLAQVRQRVSEFLCQMFSEFTDLRISVIAHGDYCDKNNPYTIRVMDFTRDEDRLCEFVKETKPTYGGDSDECYELVLHTAHTELEWRPEALKIMIMIGDASPHSSYYSMNYDHLDWVEETRKLYDEDIKVYAVHALSYMRGSSKNFYKSVAEITEGTYLTLDQFNDIIDIIKATCYQQGGEDRLNEYITIIRDSGRMTNSLDINFKRLQGIDVSDLIEERYAVSMRRERSYTPRSSRRLSPEEVTIKEMGKLVPVLPGRFQTMLVEEDTPIKEFVESNGIKFKKGRGFYELSKAETVQQYKEVIIQDRETGEMFNGTQVREELGLLPQSEKSGANERLHKSAAEKYRVFVQSTSVNRKLINGTTFLYEIDEMDDTGTVIDSVETVAKHSAKKSEKPKKEDKTTAKAEEPVKKAAEPEKKAEDKMCTECDACKTCKSRSAGSADDTLETLADSSVSKLHGAFDVEVDTSKMRVSDAESAKKEKAEKAEKAKKDKELKRVERAKEKVKTKFTGIETQTDKVKQAFNRYRDSANKHNTEYLMNNAKKLRTMLEALEACVEDTNTRTE